MAAPPIPSLAALAGDPIRTHRTWTPKYGRVQKCDFCNGRAPGTLHVCSECDIRMCENCARDRRWHIQTQHFIDADACDWTVKKAPRRLQNHGTQRASEPSSSSRPSPATRSSAPAPVPLRPSPAQDNTPSEPNRTVEDGHRVPRHGHVDAQFDARAAARHGAEDRLHAYPATYHTSGSGPSFTHPSTASAGPYDRGGMGSGLRRHQDTVPSAPSPAPTHPSDQPPAAIDLVGTRHQSRSFAHRGLLDGNGGVDNETEDGDNVHRDQDGDADDDVYNKKGYVQDVNDGPRRRSNRLVENARARTLTETCAPGRNNNTPSQPAAADSPPATTEGHDHLVLQLYEAIYGNRPNLSPGRVRTRIPDRWDGKWPTAVPQVDYGHRPSTSSQLGPQQPGPNVFGEYSREVWDATVQLQPRLPRPPAGYAEYSFHSFPQYPREQSYTMGGPYTPTSRTTPVFHPLNERTASEIALVQQDRATLGEMQQAWNNEPVLLRLCRNNHRVYAIGLLWDVFELRRTRVLVRDFSQTVHWFVCERDSQFRMQHTPPAHPPAHTPVNQAPPPPPPPPPPPRAAYPVVHTSWPTERQARHERGSGGSAVNARGGEGPVDLTRDEPHER